MTAVGSGPNVLVLDRATDAIALARAWVASELAAVAVASSCCDDVVLVASELVTNAVRHGAGRVVARLTIRRSHVELSVSDGGTGEPRVGRGDAGAVGGLGLQIVERLASRWGVIRGPDGKTVWAVLPR
jgi:anti-sigma regulatory factor (Ser/Thr protein kinase)